MKNHLYIIGIVFSLILLNVSCTKDPLIPATKGIVDTVNFVLPAGWPKANYDFSTNPLSEAKFQLGRKLFYEKKLSKDNSISCGSCHQQFAAFSHAAHSVSHGINGLFGNRNAPGLFNLNWQQNFMWDGGINNLEIQPFGPIANPVEMNETLPNIITKLSNDNNYKTMFTKAFGDNTITSQRIFKAIATFQGTLISSNSKYDKYVRREAGGTLNANELRGQNLFYQNNCDDCHKPPMFSDYSFRSNGLKPDTYLKDTGRAHITSQPLDKYKFKVPSLRNIELTAPYMHDGRYNTLEECLDHYTNANKQMTNIDPLLSQPLSMTTQDKQDIISFLKTLTDYTFTANKRFSDPR